MAPSHCYLALEVALSRPEWAPLLASFVTPPRSLFTDPDMLYIGITILGATVMPHNLYLHSSIVQTRKYERSASGKAEAIRFANIDSASSLTLALFVNAAILIVAAAVFHRGGHPEVAEIGDAYKLLAPMLGTAGAGTLFAITLLASGQNSTITGTLAGQVVMEGFLNITLPGWLRRLVTRLIAILPAVIVTALYGARGTGKLILFSQAVLSMQLSFAVFPLVAFTSNKVKVGSFVNGAWLRVVSYAVAIIIAALNLWLLIEIFRGKG